AFLSNQQDAQLLASTAIREKYATGIANGILKFLPPIFRDIGGHWAKESILRLNEQGIASGYEGKFNPDQPLTRAELMAFAERAFGLEAGSYAGEVKVAEASYGPNGSVTESVYDNPGEEPPVAPAPVETPYFDDLPEWHWSYQTMNKAVASGILRGYPDGTVRPDAPVSRAEVAVILDRLIGKSGGTGVEIPTFIDVNSQNWAYSSIMRLSSLGIVRGVAEQKYGPDRSVTRAEMATMVDRQLQSAGPAE